MVNWEGFNGELDIGLDLCLKSVYKVPWGTLPFEIWKTEVHFSLVIINEMT